MSGNCLVERHARTGRWDSILQLPMCCRPACTPRPMQKMVKNKHLYSHKRQDEGQLPIFSIPNNLWYDSVHLKTVGWIGLASVPSGHAYTVNYIKMEVASLRRPPLSTCSRGIFLGQIGPKDLLVSRISGAGSSQRSIALSTRLATVAAPPIPHSLTGMAPSLQASAGSPLTVRSPVIAGPECISQRQVIHASA